MKVFVELNEGGGVNVRELFNQIREQLYTPEMESFAETLAESTGHDDWILMSTWTLALASQKQTPIVMSMLRQLVWEMGRLLDEFYCAAHGKRHAGGDTHDSEVELELGDETHWRQTKQCLSQYVVASVDALSEELHVSASIDAQRNMKQKTWFCVVAGRSNYASWGPPTAITLVVSAAFVFG